jgi:hypothetical protein
MSTSNFPDEDYEKPLKWASVDSPITGLKGGQETLRGRLTRLSARGPRDVQNRQSKIN